MDTRYIAPLTPGSVLPQSRKKTPHALNLYQKLECSAAKTAVTVPATAASEQPIRRLLWHHCRRGAVDIPVTVKKGGRGIFCNLRYRVFGTSLIPFGGAVVTCRGAPHQKHHAAKGKRRR